MKDNETVLIRLFYIVFALIGFLGMIFTYDFGNDFQLVIFSSVFWTAAYELYDYKKNSGAN